MKLKELYEITFKEKCDNLPDLELGDDWKKTYISPKGSTVIYGNEGLDKIFDDSCSDCESSVTLYLHKPCVYGFEVTVYIDSETINERGVNPLIKGLVEKYANVKFEFLDDVINVRHLKKSDEVIDALENSDEVIETLERDGFPETIYSFQIREDIFMVLSSKDLKELLMDAKSFLKGS